ncbi:hypothetical protein [Mycobacterium intracellulare]|uniref:hypothetical protein n=1 Tax=Mycobacterium intracellulare TaxID=1767 RepID=UPI0034D51D99
MSSSVLTAAAVRDIDQRAHTRLIVTRRDPATCRYHAIGFLDRVTEGYEFTHLASAITEPGFVPLVGLSDVNHRYRRQHLFPSFAERIIGAKRPDRPDYLASLRLRPDAGPWEVLSASGGYRQGDAVELISMPTYDAATGRTTARFLAHGVRYIAQSASEHISTLHPGDQLQLRPNLGNIANPNAIQIADGVMELGYVPDPLVDYVADVLSGGPYTLGVVMANSADTNPHLRLLLHLDGLIAADTFDGPEWQTAA